MFVKSLYRSMFGQMAILTVVFVGWGVYSFIVRPIQDLSPAAYATPMEVTQGKVRDAINQLLLAEAGEVDAVEMADPGRYLAQVRAANPHFRYYARIEDRRIGNLGRPRYFHALHLDEMAALARRVHFTDFCMQMQHMLTSRGSRGFIGFEDCGRLKYIEYQGLSRAVGANEEQAWPIYKKLFWSYGANFLFIVGAIFLLFVGVLSVNMVLIRRVATVAQSFDSEHLDRQLPERGLPNEVVPLIRAVNHMIAQIDAGQRRQRFFLSAAAHEMRTPLTVLRTRLELMNEGSIKDKLIRDVRRLTNLVNQLLTLMSIGGRHEIEGSLDLVAAARKAFAAREPIAANRGIDLHLATEVAALTIAGEQGLVEIAIANLIDNALAFTDDGGRIEVTIDGAGAVRVRDFGPGIDEGDVAALFEPFVRFRPSHAGYGLGLAIVKAIVVLHHGTVDARNADGGGAEFTLRFAPAG